MYRFLPRKLQAAVELSATESNLNKKCQVLYNLLIGETAFKNKVPLRLSYVEKSFGTNWRSDLESWVSQNMSKKDQELCTRQINRLLLTAYTNRELSTFLAPHGVHGLENTARSSQIEDGVAFLKEKGEDEFRKMVSREGKLVNWSSTMQNNFIDSVIQTWKRK